MKKIFLSCLLIVLSNTAQASDLVTQSKQAVLEQLVDPESAKFSEVSVHNGDTGKIVCGRVYAKNVFGGHSGYVHFVATPTMAVLFTKEDDDNSRVLGEQPIWKAKCSH